MGRDDLTSNTAEPTERCFIGLPFDGRSVPGWMAWLHRLQQQMPESTVRWVVPADWHVTLAFLGNLSSAQQSAAIQAIHSAVRDSAVITTQLTGFGRFPNPRATLWAAELTLPAPLAALKRRLDSALDAQGLPVETRPYRPHITLARRLPDTEPAHTPLPNLPPIHLDRISLFSSTSRTDGARYTALHSVRLGA